MAALLDRAGKVKASTSGYQLTGESCATPSPRGKHPEKTVPQGTSEVPLQYVPFSGQKFQVSEGSTNPDMGRNAYTDMPARQAGRVSRGLGKHTQQLCRTENLERYHCPLQACRNWVFSKRPRRHLNTSAYRLWGAW